MTSDPEAAKRFYPSLFGWKTELFEHSQPGKPYTMWTVNGSAIGGVARLEEEQRRQGVPPHWMSSVQVRNVDETIRQAQSLGAQVVHGPMSIPDTGRYAILRDPQGAMIAIFQPQGEVSGFDGTPKVGRVSWNELMTTDFRRAFDFYRQLFGWEKIGEFDMGGGSTYMTFGKSGKSFGGMFNRMANMANVPPFWLPYVNVTDIKKATAAATNAGARIMNGPMEVPGGDWITVFGDPQNAAFAIHQSKAKSAAKPKARPKAKKTVRAKAKVARRAKTAKRAKARPRAKARSGKKAKRR